MMLLLGDNMACNTPALSFTDSPKNNLGDDQKKCLDLSKNGLRLLPLHISDRVKITQYLYLEDNFLEFLPDNFFVEFQQLKWLDLRNNYLTTLPTAGLSAHNHLEIVLLKSNLIKIVPPEFGNVMNLKGLQLADNPIENIPFEVIASGFPAVASYLRKLCNDQKPLLPVSETLITNPSQKPPDAAGTKKVSMRVNNGREKVKNVHEMDNLKEALNVLSYKINDKNRQRIGGMKQFRKATQVSTACRRLSRSTLNSYCNKLPTPDKIRFRALEDQERAKLKETLERQEKLLQRIKDAEAVKAWRKMLTNKGAQKLLDNFQYSPSRNYLDKIPFDVDPDMLKMITRADLYKSIRDIEEHERRKVLQSRKPATACNPREIESQIEQIRAQLKSINFSEINNQSGTKQLTSRIDEINKLRDTLKKLQRSNLQPLYTNVTP